MNLNYYRIKMSAMTCKDGLFYWNKLPYSGVGFQINHDSSVNAYIIDLGVITGTYHPLCIDRKNPLFNYIMLDVTNTYDGGEYFQLNGKGFDGLGFDFKNEYCFKEILFDKGLISGIAYWYDTKQLARLSPYSTNDYCESYSWTYSGDLDHISFSTRETKISLNDDRLIFISIENNFSPEIVDDYIKKFTHTFATYLSFKSTSLKFNQIISLHFSSILNLNNFLEFAYLTGHSHNVETLYIRVEENISQTKLGLLINLEKVFFEGKHSEQELELIQQKYPSIQIQLRS